MSAPVDVLAVLLRLMTDAAITRMHDHDADAKHAAAEEALAAVAKLIERDRIQSMEVEHYHKSLHRAVEVLAAIHMRCAPADITLADGRTMRFVPPDPEFYWRELSEKVKSVEAEVKAIHAAENAAALARVGGAK